jgi:hypothetical protein
MRLQNDMCFFVGKDLIAAFAGWHESHQKLRQGFRAAEGDARVGNTATATENGITLSVTFGAGTATLNIQSEDHDRTIVLQNKVFSADGDMQTMLNEINLVTG